MKFAIALALTSAAFAQQEQHMRIETSGGPTHFSYISSDMIGPEQNVPGLPYSAEQTTTTTQTLADGNRIVTASKAKVYRDLQGRTRVEHTLANIGPLSAGHAKVLISINDPVGGARYELEPDSRTASKMPQEPMMMARRPALTKEKSMTMSKDVGFVTTSTSGNMGYTTTVRVNSSNSNANAKTEDLGTQIMEGVQVKGTRTTTIIPAGSIGNDRDITMINERWYSPELKMNIMTRHSDPRMGETKFEVTNLSRANPDESLFKVPADYQIRDNARNMVFKIHEE